MGPEEEAEAALVQMREGCYGCGAAFSSMSCLRLTGGTPRKNRHLRSAEVAELLAAGPTEEVRTPYNIAPTQPVPVIRQVGSGRAIRWGPGPAGCLL